MITRLYFERRGDGCYDVVCNDYFVPVTIEDVYWAIEALTHTHRDEFEYADDIAGVRVGFMPFDMIGVMYGGVDRIVPENEREMVSRQLMKAGDHAS